MCCGLVVGGHPLLVLVTCFVAAAPPETGV